MRRWKGRGTPAQNRVFCFGLQDTVRAGDYAHSRYKLHLWKTLCMLRPIVSPHGIPATPLGSGCCLCSSQMRTPSLGNSKPRSRVTQSGQSQTQPCQSTVLCNKILWGASGFLSKASGNQAGPAPSPEQLRGSKAQGIGQCVEEPLRGGCPEN